MVLFMSGQMDIQDYQRGDFGLFQFKPHLRKGSQALSFAPGQENTNANIYPLIYLLTHRTG